MMNTSEQLAHLIGQAKADVQLAAAGFSMISSAPTDEQPQLLKEFIVGYKTAPSSCELKLPQLISDDEERHGMLRYGWSNDSMLQILQKADLSEDDFYAQLWDYLKNSPVFPDTKMRIVALFYYSIDHRLPYYKLDRDQALTMENAEYRDACRRIGDDVLGRMEYILDADFDQKTEQASLIVRMMDELPDHVSRCVFMSRIIAHYVLRFHLMSLDKAAEKLEKLKALDD